MTAAGIAAAAISALLLWASSPAAGAEWVAWVALVPAATVALWPGGGRGSRLAIPLAYTLYLELLFVPALPFGLGNGQWGDPALPVLVGGTPGPVVWVVAIPALGAVLYLIRFGQPWGARHAPALVAGLIAVIVPAAAWTALELFRLKLDPGGLWGPVFLSQSGSPGAGLAAQGGPLAVTFVVIACNYALALTLVRRRPAWALAPAALALAAFAAGALLEDESPPASLTVAAIQPGYDTAEEDRRELRYFEPGTHDLAALDTIRDLGGLTRAAARQGAEVVVWPEASMFVDPRREPPVRRDLTRLAATAGATIVVPYFDHEARRSAALAVGPDRSLGEPRPKQRPMWFLGERAAADPPAPVTAGSGVAAGTLLGVDAQDPAIAARLASEHSDLIASSTHDWPQLATQQRAMAALTARATGLPVVRADWRYGSAIYDRDGDVVADAGEENRRAAITASVAAPTPTPYAAFGDAFGWIAVAVSLTALASHWVAAALTQRRRRPEDATRLAPAG